MLKSFNKFLIAFKITDGLMIPNCFEI